MASMYRPSIREVSPRNGWYIPAIDQGDLPAQWPVCTSHQSGRSPRPMTGIHRPSIREVSPPNGWYVPRPLIGEVWPGWRFRSAFGPFGGSMPRLASMAGGAGGEMAKLVAQGRCMARLAVQNHSWPFWRASTTIGGQRHCPQRAACAGSPRNNSLPSWYKVVPAGQEAIPWRAGASWYLLAKG
jgi:hypothetical protein